MFFAMRDVDDGQATASAPPFGEKTFLKSCLSISSIKKNQTCPPKSSLEFSTAHTLTPPNPLHPRQARPPALCHRLCVAQPTVSPFRFHALIAQLLHAHNLVAHVADENSTPAFRHAAQFSAPVCFRLSTRKSAAVYEHEVVLAQA